MGQNAGRQGIVSRRPTAFNSLTPRASIITVGANQRPSSVEINSTNNIGRINSSNSMRQGFPQQPQLQPSNNHFISNPYMLQPLPDTHHFIPKPILKNPLPSTIQHSNPELSIFSSLPSPPPSTQLLLSELNFNFTNSQYIQNSLQPIESTTTPVDTSNYFQTFGNMVGVVEETEGRGEYYHNVEIKNVPLTTSIINLPSSLSSNSKQMRSQLRLLSFVDQPTRSEGYDRERYRVNCMRVQKGLV